MPLMMWGDVLMSRAVARERDPQHDFVAAIRDFVDRRWARYLTATLSVSTISITVVFER